MHKIKEGFYEININSKGFKDAKILLDDKDISNRVLKAIVDIEGGCVPVVILKLHPDDIEIHGYFEIKKEDNNDLNLGLYEQKILTLI